MKLTGRFAWILVLVVFSLLLIAPHSQASSWVTKQSMPTSRAYAGVAAVNGQLYVAGGVRLIGGVPKMTSRMDVYYPWSNTWVNQKSMPTKVLICAAAGLNGKLYIAGGYTKLDGSEKTDKLQIYNPSTNTWSPGTAMVGVPAGVASSAAAVLGGKMYVLAENLVAPNAGKKILYELNPAGNGGLGSWVSIISTTSGFLSGCTLQAIDGKLYAAGGHTGGVASNQVDVFDPADNSDNALGSWSPLVTTNNMTARYDLASGVINNKLYAVGGWNGGVCSDKTELLDPTASKWFTKTVLPGVRRGLGGAAINGTVYMVGGINDAGAYCRNLYAYTPVPVYVSILTPGWGSTVGVNGEKWTVILRLLYQTSNVADTGVTAGMGNGSIPGLVVLIPTGDAANPGKNWAFNPNEFNFTAINHVGFNTVEVLTALYISPPKALLLGNGGEATIYAAVSDDAAPDEVIDADGDGLYETELKALWLASDVAQVTFTMNTLEELKKK